MRIVGKKRMASTTVGIILAVAIIFSILTLGNNASKAQLYQAVENAPYHIEATADMNLTKFGDVVNSLNKIPHVSNVLGIVFTYANLKDDENKTFTMIYMNDMNEKVSIKEGKLPTEDFEVAITKIFSEENGIHLGDYINVTYWKNAEQVEQQFHVVGIIARFINENYNKFEMITTLETMEKMGASNAYFTVKIDPQYLIQSADINELNKKIWHIYGEVEYVMDEYADYSEVDVTFRYSPNTIVFITYLIFALPLIAMGAYLSKVGMEIELNERRIEFGILKIRGASGWSLFKFLLYESIIYALVGGIIGYIFGEFVAYIGNLIIFKLPYFTIDWNWEYAVGAIITSFILFFISLYKPWLKIKNLPIIELISHYSQKFKKVEYSPLKDIVITFILWAYLITGICLMQNVSFEGGFNIIVLIAVIILSTLTFMFPIILIILPLTMTRLLTLGTQRIYKIIAGGIAKISGVAGELVKTGASRNPKNMAYIAFILAFILTFSSFISVMCDNTAVRTELESVKSTGGDFLISHPTNIEIQDLRNSKNVSSSAVVYINSFGALYGEQVTLAYTNFKNYTTSVYDMNYFMKVGKFNNGSVIITNYLAKKYNLKVGDRIVVYIITYNESTGKECTSSKSFKIGGIAYSLPGIMYDDAILINGKPNNLTYEWEIYMILKARNYNSLKKELILMGVDFTEKKVSEDKYAATFLETIQTFLILLGGASIFIIQYSLYFNRRGEISLYKVRGASKGQITKILMIEGSTIIIISLIVGIAIGTGLAFTLVSFFFATTNLPVIFVLGMNFIEVTTIMILVFLTMQLVISGIFSRVNANEIIRSLGGEM